jgi:hypothetical protein
VGGSIPALESSSSPSTASGTNSGNPDNNTPSCAIDNAPEVYYTFTAPADGSYTFADVAGNYDSVVAVYQGTTCPPTTELGCGSWSSNPSNGPTTTVTLTQGQTVLVTVDGEFSEFGTQYSEGQYTLEVTWNDLVINGDFETGDLTGWQTSVVNEYPSNDTPPPSFESSTVHGGTGAVLVGNDSNYFGGQSILQQTITVPATGTPTLSFWYAPTSLDESIVFDWQNAEIRDTSGTVLATIFHEQITAGWTYVTYDLTPYQGQTIVLTFLARDDDYDYDPTWMYVDDVHVMVQ